MVSRFKHGLMTSDSLLRALKRYVLKELDIQCNQQSKEPVHVRKIGSPQKLAVHLNELAIQK
jgi:hypothetical protein